MLNIVTQAKNGYLQDVIKLLDEGYSVDERDKDNATPLYWSACQGYPEICNVLLKHGSEVNSRVRWGSTPLHASTDRGQIECVKVLIEGKAFVNVQNDRGDTPLHLSCYRGYAEIVRLLINARADPFLKNNNKKTALQEAHSQGFEEIVEILSVYEEDFKETKRFQVEKRKSLLSTQWTSLPPSSHRRDFHPKVTRNLSESSIPSSYCGQSEYIDLLSSKSGDSMLCESLLSSASDTYDYNQMPVAKKPSENELNYTATMQNEISKETVESFAEALQYQLAVCKDEIIELKNKERILIEQNLNIKSENETLKAQLLHAKQALNEERKARQELLRRSHFNQTILEKRVSDAETKSLSMSMKSTCLTRCDMKLCHQTILDVSRNTAFDMSELCGKVRNLWQQADSPGRLDSKGCEWMVEKDFTVIGDMPVNQFSAGKRDGSSSLVFRIKHKSSFYMLKMMINLINLHFTAHGHGNSIDEYLVDNFGPEYLVPLLLQGHPNVIRVLHYYQGSTNWFKKYKSLLVPGKLDVPIEMANRTTFLVLPEYPFSLKSFMMRQKDTSQSPLYGLTEHFLLQFFYQLLSSIVFLQSHKIVHRDIKADNILIDCNLRPVLGDFGFARCLNDSNGYPSRFVDMTQSCAGNSHAWAPEICRYSRFHPKNLSHPLLLENIYSKSDGFAASRMIYSILQPVDAADTFPTSSLNAPHYENSDIPALPVALSPEFRAILKDLVLNDPTDRPTVTEAMFRIGGLLFSPSKEEVSSLEDMMKYHQARLIALSTLDAKSWKERNTKEVLSIEDSVKMNSLEIEAHFLTHIPSVDFWAIFQHGQMKRR